MKILVAIDGSTQSSYTVQALAHFGPLSEVTLVHALPLPDLDHPMIPPEMRDQAIKEVEDQRRPEGEALLDKTVASLPSGIGTVHRIHQTGSPSTVILDTAESAKPDLILIGARGLGPIKELVLGSVSHRVLLHAPCSTLIMKTPLAALQHILIPIEGMEDAERLLSFLFSMSFPAPPRITVMSVWPQPQFPWPMPLGQNKLLEERGLDHAREMAEEVATRAKDKNFTSQATVGLGDPAFAILEQAKLLKPDLIMVGSHGWKGMLRFLLGSVSHTLVHQSPYPVLVVR